MTFKQLKIMLTDFNFNVSAKVCKSTGKVLLFTQIYVVECVHDGKSHFNLGYYLKLDDAKNTERTYSRCVGYDDITIISRTLFL